MLWICASSIGSAICTRSATRCGLSQCLRVAPAPTASTGTNLTTLAPAPVVVDVEVEGSPATPARVSKRTGGSSKGSFHTYAGRAQESRVSTSGRSKLNDHEPAVAAVLDLDCGNVVLWSAIRDAMVSRVSEKGVRVVLSEPWPGDIIAVVPSASQSSTF